MSEPRFRGAAGSPAPGRAVLGNQSPPVGPALRPSAPRSGAVVTLVASSPPPG